MGQGLIPAALLSISTFTLSPTPQASPMSSPATGYKAISEIVGQTSWIVKEGDSLASIASGYYGDEGYWTSVWNDNPWIKDPYTIEKDWVLLLRQKAPLGPEPLRSELSEKVAKPLVYSYTSPKTLSQPVSQVVSPVTQISRGTGPLSEDQLNYLGTCEAGMNPTRNSGNGFYGAFQFSAGTWNSMNTGYARADLAPLEVQKDAVQRLLARSSIYTQFPACARKMQSAGII